jgi:hypothetical protein
MKILSLIFALTIFSLPVLAKDSDHSEFRYGGGIGVPSYDTFDGESKPFRGNSIYFSWSDNLKSNRLTLRESTHGLQVVTSVNTKQAQRNWDLEYSWDEFGYSNRVIDLYIAPILGGKVKDKLSVKCREQDKVCFNSFIDEWKVTDKKQELRPLIGLNSGVRVKLFHVVINGNVFIKTDFEDSYYGIEVTLGGQQ